MIVFARISRLRLLAHQSCMMGSDFYIFICRDPIQKVVVAYNE
jgi:hypothetical protein